MMPRIPDPPPDWPSPAKIAMLFAVASATENLTQAHRRLRQFLELPGHVRITENVLLETISWEEYFELMVAYCERACAQGRMNADT
jgi:hypothetical protein